MNKNKQLRSILNNDAEIVNQNISLKPLEGSIITITGASGLVGLNLTASIIKYNETIKNKIHINAVSYNKTAGATAELFENEYVSEICCDLSDATFVDQIPMSNFIIHSAGYGQPGKFLDDKWKTLAINATGTAELIKKVIKGGSFLFLSSSEIYSGKEDGLNIETDIGTTGPEHPRACYIEGKRTGEAIVNIARENGIKASSARLALAYGPGTKNDDKRVLNQLIKKGLDGKIDLLDEGSAMRTYGYISDVVIMLLNILIDNKYAVYNVGGKSRISIKELAQMIGNILNVPVKIPNTNSFMTDAPKVVGLNLERVELAYNLKNYVDLNYGLQQTIKWVEINNG